MKKKEKESFGESRSKRCRGSNSYETHGTTITDEVTGEYIGVSRPVHAPSQEKTGQ